MHIPKGEHVEWCREYSCEGCVEDSFDAGYAAALDAAEKSVLASWSWLDWEDDGKGEQEVMFMRDAVAAIRALREEK